MGICLTMEKRKEIGLLDKKPTFQEKTHEELIAIVGLLDKNPNFKDKTLGLNTLQQREWIAIARLSDRKLKVWRQDTWLLKHVTKDN